MSNGVIVLESFNKIFLVVGWTGNDYGGFDEWAVKSFRVKKNAEKLISELKSDLSKLGVPSDYEALSSEDVEIPSTFKDKKLSEIWKRYGVEYGIMESDLGD